MPAGQIGEHQTVTDQDTDLIERIAEEHDLTREEAREVVDDVQSDADVALICADCGATEGDDGTNAVVAAMDPTHAERRALCDSCLSAYLEERTILSPQQARILPLLLAGWRTSEIADALGIAPANVSVQKTKIDQKHGDATDQYKRAKNTLEVIEDLEHRR